jgi:hypothetical protein
MKPRITFKQVVAALPLVQVRNNAELIDKVKTVMSLKYKDEAFKIEMINILQNALLDVRDTKVQLQEGEEAKTLPLSKLFDLNTGLLVAFWVIVGDKMVISIPKEDSANHNPQLFTPNVQFTKCVLDGNAHAIESSIVPLKNEKFFVQESTLHTIRQAMTDHATLSDSSIKTIKTTEGLTIDIEHSQELVKRVVVYTTHQHQGERGFLITKYSSSNFRDQDISLNQIRVFVEDSQPIIYVIPKALALGTLKEFRAEAPGHTMLLESKDVSSSDKDKTKVKFLKDLEEKFKKLELQEEYSKKDLSSFSTLLHPQFAHPSYSEYYGQPEDRQCLGVNAGLHNDDE